MYEDLKEYLNWYDTRRDTKFAADAPVIGLVLQRSHLVTGDEGHYSGVVSELEAQGAKVMPLLYFLPLKCWLCILESSRCQETKVSTAAWAVHLYVVLLCALLLPESTYLGCLPCIPGVEPYGRAVPHAIHQGGASPAAMGSQATCTMALPCDAMGMFVGCPLPLSTSLLCASHAEQHIVAVLELCKECAQSQCSSGQQGLLHIRT